MNNEIFTKLKEEFLELKKIENIINNQPYSDITELIKKYNKLKKKLSDFIIYENILKEIENTKNILKEKNDENDFKELVEKEIEELNEKREKIKEKIINKNFEFNIEEKKKDNIFLEIRAASGGNESSIFVKDLVKMYSNYFEFQKWKYEILNQSSSNVNGFKDITIKITGFDVLKKMKNESGIHRVQRIPDTEANDRVHTSTCTVAVLEETEKLDSIELNNNELRIDTYRASGAGGQHVNMTDSAVRITHLPTGIVAECQNERSQHKNKSKALSLLKSRILNIKQNEIKNEIDSKRKDLVGTGARSEKIRTYNFVQNRVTDHRINLTLYRLNDILNGSLYLIIEKLTNEKNQ